MAETKLIQRCLFKFLFIFIAIYSSSLVANDKLIIAIEHWPPYSDKDHPRYGLATEIVITALDRAGYRAEISFDDWTQILNGAEIGVFDAIVAGWHSTEREKYFEFSEPYLFNEVKFIKQKDKSFKYETMGDLRGVIVGIVQNYAYDQEFDNSNIPIKVANRHVIQNLLLLQQGKIDLTLDDELVIRHQLSKYMPNMVGEFEFIDKPLAKRGLHFLVSLENDNHEKIISDFNAMIDEMKADGTLFKILDTYKEELLNLHN